MNVSIKPGVGITAVLATWPKPALGDSEGWDQYRKAYAILLECHAYIIATGPRPADSVYKNQSKDAATWPWLQDVWARSNESISIFCNGLIANEIKPQRLLEEYEKTPSIKSIVNFDFLSNKEAA